MTIKDKIQAPPSRRKRALMYGRQGWRVFPLYTIEDGYCSCAKGKKCEHPGKHPKTTNGVKDATTDPKQIKEWTWKTANIGIATGIESGIFVLDIDGDVGNANLKSLRAEHGHLAKTVTVKTGKGRHYYFRCDGARIRNSAGKLAEGIDIRGDGGYVVGAGSVHASGFVYKFVDGRGLDEIEVATAPDWLLTLVTSPTAAEAAATPTPVPAIPPEKLNRAKAYADAALCRELERLGKAPNHQRNDTLNRCAFKLGQLLPYGLLDGASVARDLTQVAKSIGLEDDEIAPTIKSGLGAGSKHPRSLPLRPRGVEPDVEASPPSPDLTERLSKLGETDTDNAERLAARYANRIIYTKGRGWLVYKQGRWLPDALTECIEFAKNTARLIAGEAKFLTTDQAKPARAKFSKASLSKGALDRMVELTKGLVAVEDSQLDADPWLFNTVNGTVDLRTGYIEKHDPSDLLTQIAPVMADDKAKCPIFKSFLKKVTNNDKEFIRYMRRCVGYTLTGETKEQVLFFCYGKSGNNGKSTFINLIREMLGDYGKHTPTETLMIKQYDNAISNDQARLAGARMVTAIEANFNRHLDEAKLKAMTGGDKITARFMRQEFFEFTPAFKLWLAANDHPRVRGTDTALWRRIRVIPFGVQIPDAEIDLNLGAKLREEWPGILAWAVRGCIAWQKKGLIPPAAIRHASNDWADAADHLKRFVSEELIQESGPRVAAQSMYDHYEEWCKRNGETPLGLNKLTAQLKTAHNLTHRRTKRGSDWVGVKFRLK